MRIEFQSMMKRETFIALYNRPARVCFRYDGKRLCTTPATIEAIENGTSQIDVVFPSYPSQIRFIEYKCTYVFLYHYATRLVTISHIVDYTYPCSI